MIIPQTAPLMYTFLWNVINVFLFIVFKITRWETGPDSYSAFHIELCFSKNYKREKIHQGTVLALSSVMLALAANIFKEGKSVKSFRMNTLHVRDCGLRKRDGKYSVMCNPRILDVT